jgi:hypothetical protein
MQNMNAPHAFDNGDDFIVYILIQWLYRVENLRTRGGIEDRKKLHEEVKFLKNIMDFMIHLP